MEKVFRSKFNYDKFMERYAHEGCMTWNDLSKTIADQVCLPYVGKDVADAVYEAIRDMKFIPGGRYLYYAGRPVKYFNNCFSGNTCVLTEQGLLPLAWLYYRNKRDNITVKLLSPVDGLYKDVTIYEHGEQDIYNITFVPVRGRSKIEYKIRATKDHKWLLTNGESTENLKVGDIVPANKFSLATNNLGFLHGFMFGDGNKNGQLRLCSDKDQEYLEMLSSIEGVSVTYPPSSDGDPVIYANHKINWKSLPENHHSPEYIASFIEGWIAADGSGDHLLCSVDKEALRWFREYASYAGIVISGEIREQIRDIVIGKYNYFAHSIFIQNFSRGDKWGGFKVKSIEFSCRDKVYCPYEPQFNRIVIDNNIDTFNCYLLKAEEDTREDWASLSQKAEMCLTLGGGIGVDYSVYRPEGSLIKRTGGVASGPLAKMRMLNDIGRYVMQGGARRSAIYASLNWKHQDIDKFLVMKNWGDMKIGKSDLTYNSLKELHHDFPAPMDGTNISANYDTSWLLNYYKTGETGEVFDKNVEQAITTGDPGFSFNFFDKEKETLRNACCEVTSEDDSDVCNLGSVNMSRIENIHDFAEVVHLGTIFLLCGTLIADLPYQKVHDVRNKNRRLGLGLMGLHEWLLKRGSRYEVTEELHKWLSVYKGVSDETSKSYSSILSCSKPVANRSIAPTGTIGMVAGTTTGIEPVYAVSYKRRYLKSGKWHYQFVVDAAAQAIIDETSCDPSKMEGAIDLADDFERRIKFQADVQDYVDMAISSTINLPSKSHQKFTSKEFGSVLARYATRLRGFTAYPDGARGGQPLTSVPYEEALKLGGKEYEEWNDVCDITGGGYCGS